MASYHFGADGKPVKCNTVNPNGVCRIHGNTDIRANSAEEAQQKYNDMKIDEANAEDMSEMPPEYVSEAWKIHCDTVKNGDNDGMGPKTIETIANTLGHETIDSSLENYHVWNSLDTDYQRKLVESYIDTDYNSISPDAPKYVYYALGYYNSDYINSVSADYLGYIGVDDYVETGDYKGTKQYNEVNLSDTPDLLSTVEDQYGDTLVDSNTASEIIDDNWNQYANDTLSAGGWNNYDEDAGEDYHDSSTYQSEKAAYYKAMTDAGLC